MRGVSYKPVLFFHLFPEWGVTQIFTTGNVAYRIATMCGIHWYKILTDWARFQLCSDVCCQVQDLLVLELCQSRFTKSAANMFLFNHKAGYFQTPTEVMKKCGHRSYICFDNCLLSTLFQLLTGLKQQNSACNES